MSEEPANIRYEEVLAKRAEILAQQQDRENGDTVVATVAVTKLGQEAIGIPIEGIRQILPSPAVTVLPWMPPWIMGIVQVRGELMSVVDLSRWFKRKHTGKDGYLVVVDGNDGPMGLFVEDMIYLKEVRTNDIASSLPVSDAERGHYIWATTKDFISILDLSRFLQDERLIVDQSRVGGA